MAEIRGTLAAALTPLRDGGARLDEDAVGPLIEFYAATGLDGVLIAGTTGEGILLGVGERRRLAELAVGAGALDVIVHCGAQTTADTVALSSHAAGAGAAGVAVIAPPYFALADGELLEHLAAAADACAGVPFYVYEFKARSGYAVPLEVVSALGERCPNLTGLKVSDTPFSAVEPYLGLGLDVFVGSEPLLPAGLAAGAVGAVSGLASVFPEAVMALVRAPGTEGTERVTALRAALTAAGGLQAAAKRVLAARGVAIAPDVRAPLQPLGDAAAARLIAGLEDVLGAPLVA